MIAVQTLGRLRILRNGHEVDSLQGQTLPCSVLAYIAIEREATRDQLIQIFWPGRDLSKARHSLNQVLHRLRQDLGDDWCVSAGPLLRASPSVSADVVDFETAARKGRRDEALSLYPGPFLVGFSSTHVDFEHWAEAKRASLAKTFRALIRETVAEHLAGAELTLAVERARLWYDIDPEDDEAAHELMRLTALSGDRSSALQIFDLYCRRLAQQGLRPLEQTEEMVARIVRGRNVEDGDAMDGLFDGAAQTRKSITVADLSATKEWTSSSQAGPRLVRVAEAGEDTEAYLLTDSTVIGRTEGDLIFPDDPLLATPHAAIRRREIALDGGGTEARYVLQDLSSERGVFLKVDGASPLRLGDVFMAGDQVFRVDPD